VPGAVSLNGCRSSVRPTWPGHAGPLGRERPSAEGHISGAQCGERRAHRAEQDARRRTAACSRVHGTRNRATRTCRAPRCPYTAAVRDALAAGLTTRGPCRFATGPDLIAGEPAAVAAAWSADGGPGSWRLTAARFLVLRRRRRAAADRGERTGSRRSCLAPPRRARARARAAALARLVSANRCVPECGPRET
jgi:hypothetical protein